MNLRPLPSKEELRAKERSSLKLAEINKLHNKGGGGGLSFVEGWGGTESTRTQNSHIYCLPYANFGCHNWREIVDEFITRTGISLFSA